MALSYESPTVPVDGSMPYSITLVVVHRTSVLRAMIVVVDETVRSATGRGPRDRLLQRPQGQFLRVHGRGARLAHDPPGIYVGDECGIREAPVGHAHVGDVGHVQPVRRACLEFPVHEVGPAASPPRRSCRHGVPPRRTPLMSSSRMTFITWSRPTSAGSQPCANNWAWTFLYPYTAMRESEWISRMSRAKASWRATSGLAAGS